LLFVDALEIGRAGLIRVSVLKRQVLYRLS